jgi:hypothetical protein
MPNTKAARLYATAKAWETMQTEWFCAEHERKPNYSDLKEVVEAAYNLTCNPPDRKLNGYLYEKAPLYIQAQWFRPEPIVILMATGDGLYRPGMEAECIPLDLSV